MDLQRMITVEYHDCVSRELERYLKLLRPNETSVYELKHGLFYTTGLHPKMQRIFFDDPVKGTILLSDDTETLSHFGVQEGATLQLMEKISPEFQELQAKLQGGGTGRHSEGGPRDSADIYAGIEVEVPESPEEFLKRVKDERAMDEAVKNAAQKEEDDAAENDDNVVDKGK